MSAWIYDHFDIDSDNFVNFGHLKTTVFLKICRNSVICHSSDTSRILIYKNQDFWTRIYSENIGNKWRSCTSILTVVKKTGSMFCEFGRLKTDVFLKIWPNRVVHCSVNFSKVWNCKNQNFWRWIFFVICQIVHAWIYYHFDVDSCCQNTFCEFWTLITDFSLEIQLNCVVYYSSDTSRI